jgi:6-phosphogluconate dehydrogenase
MKIGFIGLGKMGFQMVERLLKNGIKVVAYNRSPEKVKRVSKKGAEPAYSIGELVRKLPKKKIIWIMLPAGKITDQMIRQLIQHMNKGDIIIDGANDFYKNAEKHERICKKNGIYFFDCGVSGGVWGLKNGYTIMAGGPKSQFKKIEPALKALAPKGGYGYFGPSGSGHFVKSVHNIVEYIYLQGLAEGAEILARKKINIKKATSVWRSASVVRSWLLDLANSALNKSDFKKISPKINSVTIKELEKTVKSVNVYSPAFDAAAKTRHDKSNKFVLGKRLIAATRREFGGHSVEK